MKNCLDTDRLVDLLDPDCLDLEAQAHVRGCQNCRTDLALMRDISAAFRAEVHVPQAVLRRTKAAIDAESVHPARLSLAQLATAGVLGTLTTLAVIGGVGATGNATIGQLIGYSVLAGAGAVALEVKRARRDRAPW